MTNEILQTAPQTVLELGVLETFLEKTKNAFPNFPEPITSLRILYSCTALVTDFQKSSLFEKKEQLEDELNSLATFNSLDINEERIQKMSKLHQELESLKPALEKEQSERAEFLKLRDRMLETKKTVFQAVLEGKAPPVILYFWRRYLLENQKRQILKKAARLGIRALIDEPLIDEVIRQELENEDKLQQILAAGKDQAQERQNLGQRSNP